MNMDEGGGEEGRMHGREGGAGGRVESGVRVETRVVNGTWDGGKK